MAMLETLNLLKLGCAPDTVPILLDYVRDAKKQQDRMMSAVVAAQGMLSPLANNPLPSVLVIRDVLSVLRGAA